MLDLPRWSGRLVLGLCCIAFAAAADCESRHQTSSPPQLQALFQDHMVLQRDQPVRVWGSAAAGARVTVALAGQEKTVGVDAAGRWRAQLPAMPPGGPFTLSVRSDDGIAATIEDVLIGDVFLCSGQSNMVLPVHRTLNSRAEIAGADNAHLRMLTVPPASSPKPLQEFLRPVEWQVAGSDTVGNWSATCYYFARELRETIRVPIGMVVAAYGGTGISTWMSEEALREAGDFGEELEMLKLYSRDRAAALARWGAVWEDWWRLRSAEPGGAEPWRVSQAGGGSWQSAPAALGPWEEWGVEDLAKFNGMVWYRTTVELSAEQAAKAAVLSLGRIDEIDQTWVNGRPVGATSGADLDRRYAVPAGLLQPGANLVVVNVLDTWDRGGIYGGRESRVLQLSDGEEILLDDVWQFSKVSPEMGWPPRSPWDATAGVTIGYNAMVAPLGSFALRGVVWYQGESDTWQPHLYGDLLTALMADWRARFGSDLPFLIVQLANYGGPWSAPAESGWAELREAQRLVAAADPRAALVVTIDLGDSRDIHPANKQEVGRRVALAARQIVYGESDAASGPMPVEAGLEGDRLFVDFGEVSGRLVAYGAEGPIGFEVCGAGPATCRFVAARIDGTRVWLRPPDAGRPERVRYCWADNPICTLYDESGLPAVPFELAVE